MHAHDAVKPTRNLAGRGMAATGLLLLAGLLGPGLTGCATQGQMHETQERVLPASGTSGEGPPVSATPWPDSPGGRVVQESVTPAESGRISYYHAGSGRFVGRVASPDETRNEQVEDVTLNFENTNLLEVIKVVLGDLLHLNYSVDPKVQGAVTLQTSRPLARESLLPTLELLLRSNGAVLVRDPGGIWRVVPQDEASKGAPIMPLAGPAAPLPPGYAVRIVPLRYIGATEMQKILEPFTRVGNVIRVDLTRNLLVLAGMPRELERLLETVAVFDVDWMTGMSVALLTPIYMEATGLAQELTEIFPQEGEGPLVGLVKFTPIERLNALLVVTPQPEYLERVKDWVERLDRETAGTGRRLFVYPVENGKAVDLADVLSKVFEESTKETRKRPASLAPGLVPGTIASKAGAKPAKPGSAPLPTLPTRTRVTGTQQGLALQDQSSIRIIPDEVNNTLLILATPQEYRIVQAALKHMDIVPLQVLIEATIAEIKLTDDLEYGLQWFFQNKIGKYSGEGLLDLDQNVGLAAAIPSFTYSLTSGTAVRAILNMLASESKLNIISSPSIMVLNNQKASLQVGDQVPITTQQQQATSTNSNVINTIEYRDTGVLLNVTPRVNAGGLVTLEIEQEVSNVGERDPNNNPTISQRKIQSTVAVQSGESVVLGGLIRENQTRRESGVPGLHTLPVVGALFGEKTDEKNRTELVVLLTPRAIRDAVEARAVTGEFHRKMESLKSFGPSWRSNTGPFREPDQTTMPPRSGLRPDGAMKEGADGKAGVDVANPDPTTTSGDSHMP